MDLHEGAGNLSAQFLDLFDGRVVVHGASNRQSRDAVKRSLAGPDFILKAAVGGPPNTRNMPDKKEA
jgi:hypothetical protein